MAESALVTISSTAWPGSNKDSVVHFVDVFSGKVLGKLEGHRDRIGSVAFAPDGKTLVSTSFDTTALIWDVSRFTQPPSPSELTPAELESCWADLARSATVGFRAIGRLVSAPKTSVAFLRERLKAAPGIDTRRIEQLIADLNSEQFKIRDLATKELGKFGELAGPALEKAHDGNVSLEVKQRLKLLLDKLDTSRVSAELLRQVRAVEALEIIGTPEARQLLAVLADGASGARQTKQAQAAIARLGSRSQ